MILFKEKQKKNIKQTQKMVLPSRNVQISKECVVYEKAAFDIDGEFVNNNNTIQIQNSSRQKTNILAGKVFAVIGNPNAKFKQNIYLICICGLCHQTEDRESKKKSCWKKVNRKVRISKKLKNSPGYGVRI